jgi:transposase
MITPEQHAEIRRLYYGEHWKVGTIAAALGVHHDTVRAAIANDTQGLRRGTCRATMLDPYLPLIRDTLAQYPRLRATRLYEMVKGRGYTGSVVQLRRWVRLIRPAATATVYRRLTTLAAEEAQIDWGAFGSIRIGRGVRPLSGFVMVLSYSRAIFALFTVDQTLESFLRGHVEAFAAFQGVARTLVYDNLRSAVLERAGTAIRFHPRLLELAGHYHFAPRPCTPGRANERGKSNARFTTSGRPSLPLARLSMSRISTRSLLAGATRSRIGASIPSSATGPWPTSSPRNSRACYRSRRIRLRPR